MGWVGRDLKYHGTRGWVGLEGIFRMMGSEGGLGWKGSQRSQSNAWLGWTSNAMESWDGWVGMDLTDHGTVGWVAELWDGWVGTSGMMGS